MENKRCAKLVLNTSLFYPNSLGAPYNAGVMDPTMGSADPGRLNCTFTNLDWRQILGDMYDKYDEFNLVLINATYMAASGTPFGNVNFNFGIMVKVEGLDWSNQAFDTYNKSVTSTATILTTRSTTGTSDMPVYSSCTFRRPAGNGLRDFTIKIVKGQDQGTGGYYDRSPVFIYTFNIYGVEVKKK